MTEALKISLLCSQYWAVYRMSVRPVHPEMERRHFYIKVLVCRRNYPYRPSPISLCMGDCPIYIRDNGRTLQMVVYLSESVLKQFICSGWSPNASGAVLHDICKDSGINRYKLTGNLSVKYVTSFMDDPIPEALDRGEILKALEEGSSSREDDECFESLCDSLQKSIIS